MRRHPEESIGRRHGDTMSVQMLEKVIRSGLGVFIDRMPSGWEAGAAWIGSHFSMAGSFGRSTAECVGKSV